MALCIAAQLACAAPRKISPDLNLHDAARDVEVIVQYKVAPTENHHQRIARLGGRLQSRMDYINAAHYTISASALDQLSADPDVLYVTPNRPLQNMMDIPAETVNAEAAAAAGYDGTGIGVAVIDSGIGLSSNFKHLGYQQSFVGGAPVDQGGRGTHVAGLIASNGGGTIYSGIVPNANLGESSGARSERQRNGCDGHQRDQYGHLFAEDVQHRGHQSFSRPPHIRSGCAGSAVPGR